MSVPKAVFVDTQVFDSQQYNFESMALASFTAVCSAMGVTLLIPAPTEDEIKRHMRHRAEEAMRTLDNAIAEVHSKASFLASWPRYPKHAIGSKGARKGVLHRSTEAAWTEFLTQVKVARLRYEGVDLDEVMLWYDHVLAPFGEGNKRKEFPDAFAVAILSAYARRTGHSVAVVSGDKDFEAACDRFQGLLYFASLPKLVEALLSEDERIDVYINAFNANVDAVNKNLQWALGNDMPFVHAEPGVTLTTTKVRSALVCGFEIIGLGERDCVVSLQAIVEAEHSVEWEYTDPTGDYIRLGFVRETSNARATTKIQFSADYTSIKSIGHYEYETDTVTLRELPSYTTF